MKDAHLIVRLRLLQKLLVKRGNEYYAADVASACDELEALRPAPLVAKDEGEKCEACNGTGDTPNYHGHPNAPEVPCDECCGTGVAPKASPVGELPPDNREYIERARQRFNELCDLRANGYPSMDHCFVVATNESFCAYWNEKCWPLLSPASPVRDVTEALSFHEVNAIVWAAKGISQTPDSQKALEGLSHRLSTAESGEKA